MLDPNAAAADTDGAAEPDGEADNPDLVERWFIRRGLPAMSPVPRTRGNIVRRALPALLASLVYWFITAVVIAPDGAVAGFAVLLALIVVPWVGPNRLRHRRPFADPPLLGWVTLVAFIVGPALILLAAGAAGGLARELSVETTERVGQSLALVSVAIAQLVIVMFIIGLVASGVAALTIWMLRELATTVVALSSALSRTLPLLLGVVTFFMYAAEVWQSIGRLHTFNYTILIAIFVALSAQFAGGREHMDLDTLNRFDSEADLRESTPDIPCCGKRPVVYPAIAPLGPAQRFNLRLVAIASRLVVATVIALGVGTVFFLIGMVSIETDVVRAWIGSDPRVIARLSVPGGEWSITWELLKVAGFLATFSGFYFSVVSSVDPGLRAGIADTAVDAVREACAARIVALDSLDTANGQSPAKRS